MLPSMRNNNISGNKLLREALRALRRRLPSGWEADLESESGASDVNHYFRVAAPNRNMGRLAVDVKRRLEPRGVIELEARLRGRSGKEPRLIIAPYLSPAVRERLGEASLGFLDLTGNARIELRKPGLFIEGKGADIDPNRQARPSRSLRGAKAGRIVRLLIDLQEPPGVRQIAEQTDVDPGYVSRVLGLLDREALIERQGRGRITNVDWPRLLRRWAEEAPLESRGEKRSCLEPRGMSALQSRLKAVDERYAITGTLAAMRIVPIAPPRLAVLYVEDLERAASELDLRPAETGANVLLIEPVDGCAFSRTTKEDDLVFAATSQVAADLLTSPGRGPQEADELIDWMSRSEEAWRG
jgi:hypothetical protein